EEVLEPVAPPSALRIGPLPKRKPLQHACRRPLWPTLLQPTGYLTYLCLALIQAPVFEMSPQRAQRHTPNQTKLLASQSARIEFKHQSLDFLAAPSFPPLHYLVFVHQASRAQKPKR